MVGFRTLKGAMVFRSIPLKSHKEARIVAELMIRTGDELVYRFMREPDQAKIAELLRTGKSVVSEMSADILEVYEREALMTSLEGKYIHRWECRDCGSQLAAGTDIENSRNGGPIEPGPVECLVCVSRPLRYLGVWDDGDSVIVRLEDGSEAGELARAKDLAVRFLLERARAMAPKRKGKRS